MEGTNLISLIKGGNYFHLEDPEVYILKNPKSYPNLNTKGLEDIDKEFLDWVIKYCPRDSIDVKKE